MGMELQALHQAIDQLTASDRRDHSDGASLTELHHDLSRLQAYIADATALFDSSKE
jgi:hypothetical protein